MSEYKFRFSYSAVSTFKQCPMRFKLQYLDRLPTLQTEALIKGNAVHDMVEELINDISKNKEITVDINKYEYKDELKHFLELETLRSEKYKNKDLYFDNTCEDKIIDEDLNTVGKLDRIYKMWTDNELVLLDYKTGKVRPKENYYPQLALYTYMYNKKHPDNKIKYWEINWLTESKKYFIEPIDEQIIEKEVKSYIEAIETIKKTTTYEPNLTPLCMWCSVLYACPYKKQALDRFKTVADRKGVDVLENIRLSLQNNKSFKQKYIYSKVAGTTFTKFSELDIKEKDGLLLKREKDNKFDKNAIAVYWGVEKIGYIKKTLAKDLAKGLDNKKAFKCVVAGLTGGKDDKNKGCNIRIEVV
ncbi:MAG: PD-(D/E)XK nuclease family protein [Bacilli bacterium]|nr:PD-(D/E)XK nuclease family protein [Bacilli bacterium]